jgi:hypothetical protein
MKAALFLAAIFACAGVGAQQAPAAAGPAPVPAPSPPRAIPKAPPHAARMSDEDMAELLRAQTSAIKALSAKIDALEIRLGNLETKQR